MFVGRSNCHPNITFHLILSDVALGFSCASKWQGLFTGMDDLAGACQKLLLFEKENTQCRDQRESGVNVPDGEIQEFNCCL